MQRTSREAISYQSGLECSPVAVENLYMTSISSSYYNSSSVCLSVCLFVPLLLRGPLMDLRQTWWVYVGGPRNCP